MAWYLLRRLFAAIPVMFFVSVVVFALLPLSGGDPALTGPGPTRSRRFMSGSGANTDLIVRSMSSICGGRVERCKAISATRSLQRSFPLAT